MKYFSKLSAKISHSIGIDLGTANTLVYVKGKGVVLNEPSVVAVSAESNQVLAVGDKAKKMLGRSHAGVEVIRPLVDGVISDYEVTEQMIKYFVEKVHRLHKVLLDRPVIVIGLPRGVTEVEQRAVEQAAESAGASKVHLIEEPVAVAIGCRLPVRDSRGSMVVDIGGGSTEIAVVSLGGIIASESLRIAGDELNEAVKNFIRDEYNLQVGEITAEMVKIQIGNLKSRGKKSKQISIHGRNIITGLPQEIQVNSVAIRNTLKAAVRPIVLAIKSTIEEAPPELSADLSVNGIVLAGGGALLPGLSDAIESEVGVQVHVAENALTAVVDGCGLVLDDLSEMKDLLLQKSF